MNRPDARPLRILHTPVDIGGHASGLAAGQRLLGLEARCISLYPSLHSTEEAVEFAPECSPARRELYRWKLFWRAMRDYDVIHLYFGESLLMPRRHPDWHRGKPLSIEELLARVYARLVWGKDLPVLRWLGKRLAFSFLGDDVRLHRYTSSAFEVSIAKYAGASYYPDGSDRWKERVISLAARYGDAMFAYNPDLLHSLPDHAQFLPYSHIFPHKLKPMARPEKNAPLRLAHAPTHTGAKGTQFILQAVQTLRGRGIAVEFDLIERVPHREAVDRIARADVFVDQLLAGWYGGAAVEAMLAGIPVVAYIRDQDLGRIPPAMRRELPVFSATPETVSAVLGDLLARGRDWLQLQGRKFRAFAERYHDPCGVARQVAEALRLTPSLQV